MFQALCDFHFSWGLPRSHPTVTHISPPSFPATHKQANRKETQRQYCVGVSWFISSIFKSHQSKNAETCKKILLHFFPRGSYRRPPRHTPPVGTSGLTGDGAVKHVFFSTAAPAAWLADWGLNVWITFPLACYRTPRCSALLRDFGLWKAPLAPGRHSAVCFRG